MASLCGCFSGRSRRIQLPSDESLQHHQPPPPRFTLHTESKNLSPRASISSRYRRTRPATIPEDRSLSTHLLYSEKNTALVAESEVAEEEDEQYNDVMDDGASQTSSAVSLPSSRITSLVSTYTGSSRASHDGSVVAPPAYTAAPGPLMRSHGYSGGDYSTAGELFRDIQRRIAATEEHEQGDDDSIRNVPRVDHTSRPEKYTYGR